MKLSYSQILGIVEVCNTDLINVKLPVKTNIKFVRNLRKLQEPIDDFNNVRIGVIDQYSEKDEEGKPKYEGNALVILDGKERELDDAISELLASTVEVKLEKFTENDLDHFPNMSMAAVSKIEPLLE